MTPTFAANPDPFAFLRTGRRTGHDARRIADSLISKGLVAEEPLTPLQIIKLVYFCHGWCLGLYERPLSIQPVRAWKYGPVIPVVYRALRSYGDSPVTSPISNTEPQFDEIESDLIAQVYEKYGHLSGIRLSGLTHAPGTPWHTVWRQKGRDAVIPDALIQKYYARLAEKRS